MARVGIIASIALSGLMLGGCYLNHGRGEVSRRDAGREIDAGRRDAGRPPDATALPDAGPVGCLGRWSVSYEWQLTEPPSDDSPSDVEWTGSGYLVGYQSSNPALDQTRFAQHVAVSGVSEPQRVFPPPSGSYGGMGIAVSGDAIGATTWDSRGCVFRSIAADGSGIADERRVDADGCVGLARNGAGFSLLDYPRSDGEVRFHRLDASGGSIGRLPRLDIFRDDVFWWTRVRFEDDSQLIAVMRSTVAPTSAVAQHIDAEGTPMSPEVPLAEFEAANRIRSVGTPSGALMGWLEDAAGDPDSQERIIRLMPVTRDGVPRGGSVVLPGVRAYRDAGWSMVRAAGEIFVVYVQPELGDRSGRETVLRAQRVDDQGMPVGEILDLADAVFGRRVIARTNGANVFVAYAANAGSTTEVFALQIDCPLEL